MSDKDKVPNAPDAQKKPVFIKNFTTMVKKDSSDTKTYTVGDVCEFTDENVLAYLLTNKYIK